MSNQIKNINKKIEIFQMVVFLLLLQFYYTYCTLLIWGTVTLSFSL